MIEVAPFKAEHFDYILETGMVDKKLRPFLTKDHGQNIEKRGGYFSILEDKKAVAIGGITEFWKGRGEAWLIFGQPRTQSFVTIFKIVQRFIQLSTLSRIEMIIECDFVQGHRWARLLGFKKECEKMEKYLPDGSNASLYALVRG